MERIEETKEEPTPNIVKNNIPHTRSLCTMAEHIQGFLLTTKTRKKRRTPMPRFLRLSFVALMRTSNYSPRNREGSSCKWVNPGPTRPCPATLRAKLKGIILLCTPENILYSN